MAQLDTQLLPLLPLTTGVVLPGMVVTLTLETEEARRAVAAAENTDGELLLVPRIGQRFSQVGTVAKVEDVGQLRSGLEALVIRGLHRAVVSRGVPGTGDATWVEVDPRPDPDEATDRARELAREYRVTIQNIVEARGVPQVGEFLRGITDPGQMADTSGYSPDLAFEQKVEVLETLDVEQRLEKVLAWAREVLAEVELKDKIRTDVRDGMEKTQREYLLRQQMDAIRKELGEDGEEDVVAEYRTKIEDANMPEGARTEAERELGRLERMSEQSPEYGWIRTYLDWMTEIPWDVRTDDNLDIAEARTILDEDHTGLDDVKDRIVEYLAVRKLREERGMGPARRPRLRRDPHARRPSGRRQDLARRVGGACARPQVRPDLAGRDPRRGRGPRAPAHLRRRAARTHRAGPQGGRHEEPGDDAGRGGQGRRRLARRPVVRAARGPRPGPEPHVPRSLPRGRPRPVRGPVHLDRERGRDDPRPAARPDGGHPARWLHGGREGRDRARPLAATARRSATASTRARSS